MRRIVCTTMAVAITIISANAEMATMGAGNETCAEFAKFYQTAKRYGEEYYFAWAQGFFSGANSHAIANKGTTRDLSSMSIKQQQQFLREYCDKHPRADYMAGVLALYMEFKPKDSRPGK
jgi:hypothetical protein